jgi:hypothetical protein
MGWTDGWVSAEDWVKLWRDRFASMRYPIVELQQAVSRIGLAEVAM